MKLLTALAIAQFVLIGLLLVRVIGLENSVDELATATSSDTGTTTRPMLAPQRPTPVATLDEERLRSIIREELDDARPGTDAAGTPRVAAATDPQQELEYDYRLEAVKQTLDFYTQTGQISESEMARLQADIAKLRPDDRQNMLGRLVRELNSGAIDGRL